MGPARCLCHWLKWALLKIVRTLVLLFSNIKVKKNWKFSTFKFWENINTSIRQDNQNEWSQCSIWTAGWRVRIFWGFTKSASAGQESIWSVWLSCKNSFEDFDVPQYKCIVVEMDVYTCSIRNRRSRLNLHYRRVFPSQLEFWGIFHRT